MQTGLPAKSSAPLKIFGSAMAMSVGGRRTAAQRKTSLFDFWGNKSEKKSIRPAIIKFQNLEKCYKINQIELDYIKKKKEKKKINAIKYVLYVLYL